MHDTYMYRFRVFTLYLLRTVVEVYINLQFEKATKIITPSEANRRIANGFFPRVQVKIGGYLS